MNNTDSIKCSECEFKAVVFDTYHRKTYCPGHALVFWKVMMGAVKDDKFEFVVIADAVKRGLIDTEIKSIFDQKIPPYHLVRKAYESTGDKNE